MPELTPRDDIKKAVSEILKRVDQLLKASELDAAMQQIKKAKEIDPKNVYVFAYEERLTVMLEERRVAREMEAKQREEEEKRRKVEEERRKAEEEKRRAEEAKRRAEEEKREREAEAKRKEEERQRAKEDEERRSAEEAVRKKDDERRKKEETARGAEVRKKIEDDRSRRTEERESRRRVPDISREVLEKTKQRILEDRRKKGIGPDLDAGPRQTFQSTYDEGLDIYRRVLFEVWSDGASTPEEEEQLSSLRGSLQISADDHDQLEREAKTESYTTAFRRAWASGVISPESASSLAELRKKFKISIEEHEQIEARLLWELRSATQKSQIMVIDDDEKLLRVIAETLQDAGFQTLAYTTTDEAFMVLKETTPDMIISDINLETSTMGGFSFYEKVREIDRLQDIPFIFLSGLTDEVLIRTGKELGVDDYITKPFSDDSLIATIKGKLKRYRQLKKRQR